MIHNEQLASARNRNVVRWAKAQIHHVSPFCRRNGISQRMLCSNLITHGQEQQKQTGLDCFYIKPNEIKTERRSNCFLCRSTWNTRREEGCAQVKHNIGTRIKSSELNLGCRLKESFCERNIWGQFPGRTAGQKNQLILGWSLLSSWKGQYTGNATAGTLIHPGGLFQYYAPREQAALVWG